MRLHYARPYWWLAVPITLLCGYFTWLRGPAALSLLMGLKFSSVIVGLLALRKIREREVYFYLNLGYGERGLLLTTGLIDLTVWTIVTGAIIISGI